VKKQVASKGKTSRLEKLAVLNLAFLALIYTLNKWVAEATSVTTLIAYLPTFIWLLPTVGLIIACLFAKRKKSALLSCACACIFGLILTGFSVPAPFSEIEGHEFSLMTFNIHHASEGWDGIRKVILEKKPYIVCFQEADDVKHRGSAVGDLPGYFVERWGGLAIASTERLSSVKPIQLSAGTREALEARAGNGARIVNVHLKSFNIGEYSRQPWSLPRHVKTIADMHQIQIEALVAKYEGKPDCVITGDFNNPPSGDNYRTLNRKFNDAFGAKGWGFGYTYPSQLPLLRIDYAFTTDVRPLAAEVINTTQSDHRPVFFKLLLYRPT
jgi:vancomycin resistance protein VanJ